MHEMEYNWALAFLPLQSAFNTFKLQPGPLQQLQRLCRLFLLSSSFWILLALLAETNCGDLIKTAQG